MTSVTESADTAAPSRPSTQGDTPAWPDELTPREVVAELDKYIIGQSEAKKAVAIALRNRWRRQQVDEELREEILPNNLIMIGPTGVGKTEIARRLARLAGSPFIKVEASKFTEVGYVGRDVESMIRDLVDTAVAMVRSAREDEVEGDAERHVEEKLLDLLLPESAVSATAAKPRETPDARDASRAPTITGSPGTVFVAGPAGGSSTDTPISTATLPSPSDGPARARSSASSCSTDTWRIARSSWTSSRVRPSVE